MPDFPRVFVTGIGIASPLGLDATSTWQNMLAGKSGIARISLFDPEGYDVQIAGELKGFVPEDLMERRVARRSGRHTQMAVVAAAEAVKSACLEIDDENRDEIGVFIASSGSLFVIAEQDKVIEQRGPQRVDPLTIPRVGQYSAAMRIGRELCVRGPNSSVNTACASGGDAIGQAMNFIRLGHAQCMIAGASEALINRVCVAGLANLGALAKTWNQEPERSSRPFDARRSGFVLGEGAALLVLETADFARARGAHPICELAGAGWSFDAADDAAPDVDGQALAMVRALKNAALSPADISYINAHGTATELNDRAETAAVKQVFGKKAASLAISSTKSMTGHLAAAAGALEAAVCALAIRDQVMPPTINYEFPDPACDLDYVPNRARETRAATFLSNSFGFGGMNAVVAVRTAVAADLLP